MHAMNGSSSHSSNSSSSDQTAVGNRTNDAAATSSSSFRHAHPAHWQHRESLKMLGFHHPTHVSFYDPKHDVLLHWNSRKHRKGRLPVAKPAANTSSTPRWTKKKSFPRLFGLDLQDISWHVGMLFLVGSLWWCANGVMAFNFYTVSTNAIANAEAATAFLGGSWFLIGSYLSFVESLNPSRDTDFGYEVDEEAHKLVRSSRDTTGDSLGRSRKHFGKHASSKLSSTSTSTSIIPENTEKTPQKGGKGGRNDDDVPAWRWWGSDWHSLGFVANAIQLFGAVVFWVSVLCGLPGVLPEAGSTLSSGLDAKTIALWETFYWATQIIGAPCFVISGAMFALECQKKWWLPAPLEVGWQVGIWNFIGGMGFWMCGIFGTMRETGGSDGLQKWGTAFSTYWGSWAFLIGSYFQFYETLNK